MQYPFWKACLNFIEEVLGEDIPPSFNAERAVIFGHATAEKMLSTQARALLRHGWRNLYRHFTLIETKGQHLSWEHVFFDTLRDYKSAVLRVKHTITVQLTSVRHGRRPIRPPPRSAIYPALVNEDHNNPNQLSNAFTHALHTAESAVHT